ncbi:hypothetical protein JW824_01500 [bacterium]|nr:hypothetical protein [bacterium]
MANAILTGFGASFQSWSSGLETLDNLASVELSCMSNVIGRDEDHYI